MNKGYGEHKQTGFTLIELMISTTIFSIILLAAATTLIQISRMYYKGVISSKTQGATRAIVDEVGQNVQFGGGEFVPTTASGTNPVVYVTCIGKTRFTYALQAKVSESIPSGSFDTPAHPHEIRHALWQDTITDGASCDSNKPNLTLDDVYGGAPPAGSNGRELLEQNMRLTDFSIEKVSTNDESALGDGATPGYIFNVKIGIIYGDDDLLLPDANNPTACKGSIVGAQWCAVSELSTSVYRRVE